MSTVSSLSLEGPLTSAEVCHWHSRLIGSTGHALPDVIDLSKVTRCDSSALALLLELQSKAANEGRRLAFTSPPQALTTLAILGGVDGLLGWQSTKLESSGA